MNEVKRLKVLMVMLLISIGIYFANEPNIKNEPVENIGNELKKEVRVEKIENKIHSVKVTNATSDSVTVEVDFGFDGKEKPGSLNVIADMYPGMSNKHLYGYVLEVPIRETKKFVLKRQSHIKHDYSLTNIKIVLSGRNNKIFDEKNANKKVVLRHGVGGYISNEKNSPITGELKNAVKIIDESDDRLSLISARNIIDKVIYDDPDNLEAYIALARFHIKSSEDGVGLKYAEKILNQSLVIDKDYANTHVLLGHVYSRQKRYDEAISEYKIAETLGSDNPWLYVNWAYLYSKIDKKDDAYKQFERVISAPRVLTREDRALRDGFTLYLRYVKKKFDYKKIGSILERRYLVFPDNGCYQAEFAEYLVTHKKAYAKAEKIARSAIDAGCSTNGLVNKVLAKVLLVKSIFHDYEEPDMAFKDYKRSGVLYNNEARLVAELSDTNDVSALYKRLKKKWNINIDDKGIENAAPIAYCVNEEKYLCVENLLSHGASANQTVNERGWSLLMIAAYEKDKAMVRRLLLAGANPDYRSPDGASAHIIAKLINDKEIERILKRSSKI